MTSTVAPIPTPDAPASIDDAYGIGPRIALAALSAGAGVVHLAMAPIHASASSLEGVGFAAAGWFQLIVAAALVAKPNRRWLQAAVVANMTFIGVWAWSRTVGLPFGAHPGQVESIDSLDLLTVVLEGLLVVGAGVMLAKPSLARSSSSASIVVASAVPVAVLLLTITVMTSPSASGHSHGPETADGLDPASVPGQLAAIEANRCDKDINPVSYWRETEIAGIDTIGVDLVDGRTGDGHTGHSHDATAPTTTATTRPDPLAGRGSPTLDKLVSKMNSESEVDAGIVVAELANATPQEYDAFLYQLGKHGAGDHAHAASGDDTGGHGGHIGPNPWVSMTDQALCDQLDEELQVARDTALALPTAADAKAAGYTQVTPYVPGIAAHWMKFPYVDGTFEVDKPEMVLYDGSGLDARVVGLSYYIVQNSDAEPTQGFTGDNDHYHRHIGLCSKGALVIGDSTTTEEECAAQGGRKGTNRGGWMSHAWVVPGCESPWGVFSGASPVLDMQLAQTSGTGDGSCNGSKAKARYDLRPGSNAPPPAPKPASETAAGD
jgi:hypothetical protein